MTSPMRGGSTTIRIDKGKLDRAIENALMNPRAKATLSRIANEQGRRVAFFAEQLAEEELNRRPEERRTAESRAHGKEYHDSFSFVVDMSNPRKIRIALQNDHPAARRIEKGTRRHDIPVSGTTYQRFPGDPTEARGGIFPVAGKGALRRGQKGQFPIEGPPWVHTYKVDHPGTAARNIMARALDRYRKATRNRSR